MLSKASMLMNWYDCDTWYQIYMVYAKWYECQCYINIIWLYQDSDMNVSVYNNKGKIKWDYLYSLMILIDEFWGQNS